LDADDAKNFIETGVLIKRAADNENDVLRNLAGQIYGVADAAYNLPPNDPLKTQLHGGKPNFEPANEVGWAQFRKIQASHHHAIRQAIEKLHPVANQLCDCTEKSEVQFAYMTNQTFDKGQRVMVPRTKDFPNNLHIDGGGKKDNKTGYPQKHHRHTLICGLVLKDISSPREGPLMYMPGSHKAIVEKLHETRLIRDQLIDRFGIDTKKDRKHFIAKAGDVIFMHYMIFHGTELNYTDDLRAMMYIRFDADLDDLTHTQSDEAIPAHTFRDLWRDFDKAWALRGPDEP
jgi:ectoine hydroxylase-related dioxygenase (phytanoyl-CoA dioxygenase family)